MALPLALPSQSHPLTPPLKSLCCRCFATSLQDNFSSSQLTTTNYRPAVILPGLGNNKSDYEKLEVTLKGYGVPTVVAKVSRIDWLRNAAGLADPNYWRGTLRPRPVLDWYLKRVDEAVNEAKELAGGRPPPKGSPGVIDQTRGLLNYVEKHCSKAVYTPELRYVCIAGRYIQGARFFAGSNANSSSAVHVDQADSKVAVVNATSTSASDSATLRARFIGQGFAVRQTCWGDGVVPEVAAHLEGALNISFDRVYHSPVGSDDSLRPWYGSPAIVEQWIHHLLN
ncbi:alpha/beta-Hydrolases superfamily protein [Actinidia rufa]|uniref:Alpha/beta-Hydrolases superfamily protein n=1 Tax=Actinidia rufa TaxID=165716 RepID=A0A7J0FVI7_9ERIC|nr:alpha/beta-Hydrolases superfamily protein [Actinidia rufa]